ncbi:MAG: PDZ domain-containing protein [Terriglobales bacterium]|jgi:hypothetical protein
MKPLAIIVLTAVAALGQAPQPALLAEPGMYVEASGGLAKIVGQIAEFKRSGSRFANHATIGIKTRKENIQLLGAHAQSVVSPQPVFYFLPARQESDAGVSAGDLILMRLEEKSSRRQFEIAAQGLWRSSAGITLTHQIQLLRSEIRPEIYKLMPAVELKKGEYALFLSRGEGMAAYVYDFSVQGVVPIERQEGSSKHGATVSEVQPLVDRNTKSQDDPATPDPAVPQSLGNATIGAFFDGNPDVRRNGITVAAVTPGGPAEQGGIRVGDTVVAVNDRYLYTIRELTQEISRYRRGTAIRIRYRRHTAVNEATVVVGGME